MASTVHYYRDNDGQWRWRAISTNGRIVADSSEAYRNRADAENHRRHKPLRRTTLATMNDNLGARP